MIVDRWLAGRFLRATASFMARSGTGTGESVPCCRLSKTRSREGAIPKKKKRVHPQKAPSVLASEAAEGDLCARGAVVRPHTCSCVCVIDLVWKQSVDLVVNKETANEYAHS